MSVGSRVREELGAPQAPAVIEFARHLARHYGPGTAAILFYGSCLRTGTIEGLLDFYLLVDGYRTAGMSGPGAIMARLLPPTVHLHRFPVGGTVLRAKVAVISRDEAKRRVRAGALDPSTWARLCQPMALVYARSPGIEDEVTNLLTTAVLSAAGWAARLGPDAGSAGEFWSALFRATYGAELRVEPESRASHIYEVAGARFDAVLIEAWGAPGLTGGKPDHLVNPLPVIERRRGAWRPRRWIGKALNILRLVKAAFTFDGGADYVAWKIERHSGHRVMLTSFQRRHPVLAAPAFLWWAIRHRLVR